MRFLIVASIAILVLSILVNHPDFFFDDRLLEDDAFEASYRYQPFDKDSVILLGVDTMGIGVSMAEGSGVGIHATSIISTSMISSDSVPGGKSIPPSYGQGDITGQPIWFLGINTRKDTVEFCQNSIPDDIVSVLTVDSMGNIISLPIKKFMDEKR